MEITVFADNWVLVSNALSRNEFVNELFNINAHLSDYNLTFTIEDIEIMEI